MIDAKDRLNIKDLVVEEPQREKRYVFRPEEEIGDDLWNFTINILNHDAHMDRAADYSTMAYQLGVMFPERQAEIVAHEKSKKMFLEFIDITKDSGFILPLALEAYYSFMKTTQWGAPPLSSGGFGQMHTRARAILSSREFYPDRMDHLAFFKLAGGVSFDELRFDEETYRIMLEQSKVPQTDRLNIPADIRILYPHKPVNEIISDYDLDTLRISVKGHWQDRIAIKQGVDAAFRLYILTAESIEPSNRGLKINLPPKPTAESTETTLPEVRRF